MAAKPKYLTTFARIMRQEPTVAEKLIWNELRDWHVPGLRLRRQFVIGQTIADFACPKARLILEVDGASHDDRAGQDAEREAWLVSEGWQVVRASNAECLANARGVAEWFVRACAARAGSSFFEQPAIPSP